MRYDKDGWLTSAFAKALASISFMLLWGCASGPNLVSMQSLIKPPPVGQGRIYIYRESAFGAAVQPQVFLNGEPVGRATPGGVYLVDRPPGRYSVSVQTEVENTASFELAAGQAQYFRLDISIGLLVARIEPVVVDPQAGASEAGTLSLSVGLALDRGAFTVEDRDRVKGIYFVRYLEPDYEAQMKDQQGLFSKMLGKDKPIQAPQYQVQVSASGQAGTQVQVFDKDGKPVRSAAGDRILALLSEQLR